VASGGGGGGDLQVVWPADWTGCLLWLVGHSVSEISQIFRLLSPNVTDCDAADLSGEELCASGRAESRFSLSLSLSLSVVRRDGKTL